MREEQESMECLEDNSALDLQRSIFKARDPSLLMSNASAEIRSHQHAASCLDNSLHLGLPWGNTHLQGNLGAAKPLRELCRPLLSSNG